MTDASTPHSNTHALRTFAALRASARSAAVVVAETSADIRTADVTDGDTTSAAAHEVNAERAHLLAILDGAEHLLRNDALRALDALDKAASLHPSPDTCTPILDDSIAAALAMESLAAIPAIPPLGGESDDARRERRTDDATALVSAAQAFAAVATAARYNAVVLPA